jgi:hypothetical protein
MNQYIYDINYTSPKIEEKRVCIHLLIIENSDEKCYELAVNQIEEKYLSELDNITKQILSIKVGTEFNIENLLKNEEIFPRLKSYLFNTIQHSRRYFTEESSVLKIEVSEIN